MSYAFNNYAVDTIDSKRNVGGYQHLPPLELSNIAGLGVVLLGDITTAVVQPQAQSRGLTTAVVIFR